MGLQAQKAKGQAGSWDIDNQEAKCSIIKEEKWFYVILVLLVYKIAL